MLPYQSALEIFPKSKSRTTFPNNDSILIITYFSNSRKYFNILKLCSNEDNIPPKAFWDNSTDYDWAHFTKFIDSSSQSCNAMVLKCKFGGAETNCSNIFIPVITDEGLCCAYNTVDSTFMFTREARTRIENTRSSNLVGVDWTAENGYPPDLPPNHFPQEAVGPGESEGLTVILDANVDDYFCSSTNVVGFKVILHNPTETPAVKELGLYIPTGQETKFRIRVSKLDSTPDIKSVAVSRRQCVFNDEGELLYFQSYSRSNCEMECQAARYIKYCNCIEPYMPRIYSNATLCGLKDLNCIRNIGFFTESLEQTCAEMCLPGCFELTYDSSSFSVPFSINTFGVKDKFLNTFTKDYAAKNLAIFHFYYRDYSFKTFIQSQYIGMTEFLCEFYIV